MQRIIWKIQFFLELSFLILLESFSYGIRTESIQVIKMGKKEDVSTHRNLELNQKWESH